MLTEDRQNELAESYRACREDTRAHAKSFYFASHVLPRAKRMASYAVYAFCRRADDVVDCAEGRRPGEDPATRVRELREQLRLVYEGSRVVEGYLPAFRDTVTRYGISQEYFLELIRGVEMDLTKHRYSTFEELTDYCYCVASVVGLMMTRIFGVSDERAFAYAIDLGRAMQLTNILRDVGEDRRLGRIYLPAEDLDRFSYTEEDLRRGRVNENFRALMQFQIDRARATYRSASAGIPMLTDDGSRYCVRLMSRIYEQILAAIERNNYNVFTRRAVVPLTVKLRIAVRAALQRE